MAEWTAEDAEQAKAEGWGLFECSGSEDGPWQLQKFDDPDQHLGAPSPYPFVADVDVWVHVRTGKTPLHRKALAFLAAHNPQEHGAISTWNA